MVNDVGSSWPIKTNCSKSFQKILTLYRTEISRHTIWTEKKSWCFKIHLHGIFLDFKEIRSKCVCAYVCLYLSIYIYQSSIYLYVFVLSHVFCMFYPTKQFYIRGKCPTSFLKCLPQLRAKHTIVKEKLKMHIFKENSICRSIPAIVLQQFLSPNFLVTFKFWYNFVSRKVAGTVQRIPIYFLPI